MTGVDQQKVEDVRRRHEDELMALPNVVSVGVGERAGKPVIHVMVTHVVPESELAPEHVVPREIEGCDVVVADAGGELTAEEGVEHG